MVPGQTLEGMVTAEKQIGEGSASHDLALNIECIAWSTLVTMRNITSDEYGLLCTATDEDDSIMHWSTIGSITDTAATTYRVIRGNGSASKTAQLLPTNRYEHAGLRPAFEALTPDTDCAGLSVGSVVMIGTLYVGSDPVQVPTNPVKGGDITNYDKDGSGVTSKITLSTALEDTAYHMKAVYVGDGLFVCDRVMLNYINWNQINAALTTD